MRPHRGKNLGHHRLEVDPGMHLGRLDATDGDVVGDDRRVRQPAERIEPERSQKVAPR